MEEMSTSGDHVKTSVRNILLHGDSEEKPSNQVLGVISKIICSYQLMDTMLYCCDWPQCIHLAHVPRRALPEIGPTLGKIQGHLRDWTSVIPDVNTWASMTLKSLIVPSQNVEPMTQNVVARPSTTVPIALTSGNLEEQSEDPVIKNFLRSMSHGRMKNLHDVMEQWYAVGLAIAALQPVSHNS